MRPSDFLPVLWVDIETTGLLPAAGQILEVAIAVTDVDLHFVSLQGWVVKPQSLLVMDEDVRRMHDESGLIRDVNDSSVHVELHVVEDVIRRFVGRHFGGRKPVLGGSSVHFDRAWLERYMPRLMRDINYRNIDVSSIKELAKVWAPEVFREWADGAGKEKAHRAQADIVQTLSELRLYAQRIFGREMGVRTAA